MKIPTVFFFWDYDTQWGADRSRISTRQKDWGPLEFSGTDTLLELHQRYEIPACFAVVGAAALPGVRPYHDPEQIRRIHEAGHEVASHSFKHEWLPQLDRKSLIETLQRSKDAIEQCIGDEVVSFVPPFNQPFDYPSGFAFSLSERKEVRRDRTDLSNLCEALAATGYKFCRVAYRPLYQQVVERLMKRDFRQPSSPKVIEGVVCLRLNTPGGFDKKTESVLEACLEGSGVVVVYGHPHSIHEDGEQNVGFFEAFLRKVNALRREKRIRIGLPREIFH
jgi:hypothetical protein